MRHLLDVDDLSAIELTAVLDRSEDPDPARVLAGAGVGLLFDKASTRTRHSVEMAIIQLGGRPISAQGAECGIDSREPAEDISRTLSCFHSAIGVRVCSHATLERMAAVATVPVINLLSDTAHPCQTLADLLTIRQHFGSLEGITVAYIGDGNNVCQSLMLGASLAGCVMRIATPPGYGPDPERVARARAIGHHEVTITNDPIEAVAGANVVYTDVWTPPDSLDGDARRQAFRGFTVDDQLMSRAAPGAIFLHCLPAHRGEEVTGAVCDGNASAMWRLAANRMHTARGLLSWLMTDGAATDRST